MCGICGELTFTDAPVRPDHIQRMARALAHRGPDDEGLYCNGPIGLGHRRLAIIDLSRNGRQPMWTADRSKAIVFNGEVYNHSELRRQLVVKGYRFTSITDSEVVLNAVHGVDDAAGSQEQAGFKEGVCHYVKNGHEEGARPGSHEHVPQL